MSETTVYSSPGICDVSHSPDRDLGKFLLICRVGRGGMGEVWKAWSKDLRREVALKFGPGSTEDDLRRFHREAQVAARLSHPNIVTVYEVGECRGRPFFVMPWINGCTIDQAGLKPREAIEAMRRVCAAVNHAHEQGIIHRDLKPQNILVEKGAPYVTDFGLAHQRNVRTSLSASGIIIGTPEYMSPEQAQGLHAQVDERSDVYSLGATLYRLVTGTHPYDGIDPYHVLSQIATEDPPPPRKVRRSLSRDVETVILCAMSRARERRYATAAEMGEDLQRILDGEPVRGRRPSTMRRVCRKALQNRPALLLGLGILLLAAGGGRQLRSAAAERAAGREREARRARAAIELDLGLECARRLEAVLALGEEPDRRLEQEALERFRRALELDPGAGEAALQIARIHMEFDRTDEAREWCDRAGRCSPGLTGARLLRAQIDLERYQALRWDAEAGPRPESAESAALLREIQRDLESASPDGDLAAGIRALAGGEVGAGLGFLRRHVGARPEDWRAHKLLATVLLLENRAAEAVAHAERVIRMRPRLASAHLLLGMSRYRRGDFMGAIGALDKALELRPGQAGALQARAICRKAAGDSKGALEDLDRLVEREPGMACHWINRGNVLLRLGRRREALESYDRALAADPSCAEALSNRAAAHYQAEEYSGALEAATRALRIRADCVNALFVRALARRKLGDSAGAVEDHTAAIALRSEEADYFYSRANARQDLDDLAGAMLDFLEAIRLRPAHAEAHANLGLLYEILARRRPGEAAYFLACAEEHLRRALDAGGPNWFYKTRAQEWLRRVSERRRCA